METISTTYCKSFYNVSTELLKRLQHVVDIVFIGRDFDYKAI